MKEHEEYLFAARIVEVMNEALARDHDAIRELATHEVSCNRALGEHRGMVIGRRKIKADWLRGGEAPAWSICVLGVLNAVAGLLPDGYGRIEAVFLVECPRVSHCEVIPGDVRLKGLVVGDKCPACGSELVLGKLEKFQLSDVQVHRLPREIERTRPPRW